MKHELKYTAGVKHVRDGSDREWRVYFYTDGEKTGVGFYESEMRAKQFADDHLARNIKGEEATGVVIDEALCEHCHHYDPDVPDGERPGAYPGWCFLDYGQSAHPAASCGSFSKDGKRAMYREGIASVLKYIRAGIKDLEGAAQELEQTIEDVE